MEGYLLRCLAPLAEAEGELKVLQQADALLAGVAAPPGAAWLAGSDAYLSVARAWLARDEPARARAVLTPLLVAAESHAWLPVLAAGALVDGAVSVALGERDRAARCGRAALEIAERHGMPHLALRARALIIDP